MLANLTALVLLTAAAERPNILFIYTDDHSHRSLACYPEAYPFVRTPNLDRLAKEGVRFAGAYNGSWCAPSRATSTSGRCGFGSSPDSWAAANASSEPSAPWRRTRLAPAADHSKRPLNGPGGKKVGAASSCEEA